MNCPTCRQSLQIFTAKTERNRGRKFVSCKRHDPQYFTWVSEREREAVEFAQKTVNRILAGTPQLVKPILNDAAPLTGSDETTSTPPENGNENKTEAGLSEPISGAGLGYLSQLDDDEVPNAPVVKKQFTPSPYQIAIRDFVIGDPRNLQIKAYAGSGKTSTNAWVTSFIPEKSADVAMMVFSKANQLDMQKKIPQWIPATTTHASGFSDIRRAFGS